VFFISGVDYAFHLLLVHKPLPNPEQAKTVSNCESIHWKVSSDLHVQQCKSIPGFPIYRNWWN